MTVVWPGPEARADRVGNKAFRLARLLQAGLPVPLFFSVTAPDLDAIGLDEIEAALQHLHSRGVAVRSSALEEDHHIASFAGMYATQLNVTNGEDIKGALQKIVESVTSPAVLPYRTKHRLDGTSRMAAIVQELVTPISSGVLFTRDPLSGADQIVVEASWGLGASVVAGLVKPDRWVLSQRGEIISSKIAHKTAAIVPDVKGGTLETAVEPCQRSVPCLNSDGLQELLRLAAECERLFGEPQDIEWAADSSCIWLLQSRPITALEGG
jgi:pyruvate,water dikinase